MKVEGRGCHGEDHGVTEIIGGRAQREIDRYRGEDGVAMESQYGRVGLGQRIRSEITTTAVWGKGFGDQ